jgi:hypothetical protein
LQRDQQIRVNELLLQREELFLRIHAAETEAARLLGEPFPFVRPRLPSDFRAKKKSSASAGKKPSAAPSPPDALRRLDESERAYRVTYRQFSQTVTETHHDHAALATLLASQAAHLQVLRLETLNADGTVRAVLISTP